jgi:3-oxoacyl-[acyl-carrier-protein] synthase II
MSLAASPSPRIAVTGIGLVTPHGAGVDASWEGLRSGRLAVRELTLEELLPEGAPLLAAEGPWRDGWAGAPAVCGEEQESCGEPAIGLSLRAAAEAAGAARLHAVDPLRRACIFGTSKGGLQTFARLRVDRGASESDLWRMVPPGAAAEEIARRLDCRGPLLAPVAACATGLVAMIRGVGLLRSGDCDVALAGAGDASLQLPALASFRRLGVQADLSSGAERACRPCDARRSGFLVGEGAGAVVLERYDDAVRRGAPILAEWVDALERCDPAGLTVLPRDPECLVRLIRDLLRRCRLEPKGIQGVSLHATGTRMNDAYETQALSGVFGDSGSPLGFGLKGGIGHLLGAAGSVETVASICALRDQRLPPTVNLDHPAPDCPFPLTGAVAQPRRLEHLLKISLGFGGHLAACVLRRPGGEEAV